MKGADSHGSCKNYYKNFVVSGAYMPDNHTAGGYAHHMDVCNGISYPVGESSVSQLYWGMDLGRKQAQRHSECL